MYKVFKYNTNKNYEVDKMTTKTYEEVDDMEQ